MCADTISTGKDKKPVRRKFRALKLISIVIVGILLAGFFGVPAFLSSSAGTGFVVNKVNKSLDGEIGMEDLNVGWFKGVHLKEFSFADDKGLAKVNVKEITAKPKYTSILSGNISLGKVVVDKPVVSIRLETEAASDKAAKSAKNAKSAKGRGNAAVIFNQIDLTIKDGDVKILPAGAEIDSTIHFSNIASKVDLKETGKKSSFDLGMDVESKGRVSKISANGNVKSSKKGWSFKGTEGDMTVKVDDLDLSTLSPVFDLLDKDIDIAGDLNVDAEVKFGGGQVEKLVVDAELNNFKHVAGEKIIALDKPITLKGQVSTKNDKVNIEDINLKSSFCTITGKGTGSELDYIADMDIGKTMDFVGTFVDLGEYGFTGTCYEKGHITFKDDTIRFSDHSGIDNFVMTRTDEKGKKSTPPMSAKFTFDMTVDMKEQNTKVDFLTMKTTDTLASMRIEDSVFSWDKDAKEKIDMKLKADVNLAKAKPFAMFFDAMPENMAVDGLAETELSLRLEDGGYRIKTMPASIKNLKITTAGAKKPFEDKSVVIWLDMLVNAEEKQLTVNKFKVDGTKIDVEGSIKQSQVKNDQTKVSGEVTAKYDLADVSTVASAYLPEGIEVAGKRSDTFKFESQYPAADKDKMIANMNASGKLGFDRAKYMGMKIGKVNVGLDVKNGVLDIAPFSTSVNNGTLNFAGNVDLTKEPMVFSIPKPMQVVSKVQIDDEMGKKLLKYLNPLFAGQADLSGIGSLYCDKLEIPLGGDTAIADAKIAGTVTLSDMQMKNSGLLAMVMSKGRPRPIMQADMLPTKIVMNKGIVKYDDMQVNIDKSYPVNFRGGINLNVKPGKFENMSVSLPFTKRLETVRIGDTKKNRLQVPVKGNVDKPEIDLGGVLEGVLEEEAGRLLDKYLGGKDKKKKDSDDGEKSDEEKIIEGVFDFFKKPKKGQVAGEK